MRELVYKTNYGVLLWHFVDRLSTRNSKNGKFFFQYYCENFELNSEDELHLDQYSKLRSIFHWSRDSDFYEWAYKNFPQSKEFSPLLEHILYFETRKNKEGKYLSDILKERASFILNLNIPEFSKKYFKEKKLNKLIAKLGKLFGSEDKETSPLDVFIPTSMASHQGGGVRGGVLFVEVGIRDVTGDILKTGLMKVVFHEYVHQVLGLTEYFKGISKFNVEILSIFPGPFALFLDEVITYSVSDVYVSHLDIEKKIVQYEEESAGSSNVWPLLNIWLAIKKVYPLIQDYLDDSNPNPEKVRKALFDNFENIVLNEKI